MHRLTVVQLLPALQSGGVERSTLEIAAALVRAGHRAVVVSAGGRLVQPLLEVGAEHLTLDIGRKSLLTLRHVVGLRRLFTELGADIVHARSRLPAWLGWYALRGMPPAMVWAKKTFAPSGISLSISARLSISLRVRSASGWLNDDAVVSALMWAPNRNSSSPRATT